MNEQELRAIADSEELEGKDVTWQNDGLKYTGHVLFDYDQGLSVLNKEDSTECLAGFHGPSYKKRSNYTTKEIYHEDLNRVIPMISKGYYTGLITLGLKKRSAFGGSATCSFT